MFPLHSFLRRALVGTLAASSASTVLVAVALLAGACAPVVTERGSSYSASELGIEVSRSAGNTPAAAPSAPPPAAAPAPDEPTADEFPAPPPGSFVTPGERLGIAGCPLFPRDNAFRAWVGALEVHPDSDAMIAAGGGMSLPLRAGFSAGQWHGSRSGYPVNIADSRSSRIVSVVGGVHASTSDLDGHPMPEGPRFEGWPRNTWDRHLLVVDPASCTSHEMIGVTPPWQNPLRAWFVDKAVKLDLRSNAYRPTGSVKVAGVSMLAGLIRYDEVASGRVGHVIAMSIPTASDGEPVWPARNSDGTNADPYAPPMGSWLRLKAGVDLSGLAPQAATVARALKEHGGVLVDTAPHLTLSGEPDLRWDDADLSGLRNLTLDSFEIVDPTPMMVGRNSLQIR